MRRRHDLIGTHIDESLDARVTRARGLLEDLVEPAWRFDPPILVHPRHMVAVCAVAGCAREAVDLDTGLCNGHGLRWIREGRPDLPGFVAATRSVLVDNHVLARCRVPGCRLGEVRPEHLCPEHRQAWMAAGRPDRQTWAETAALVDDAGIGAAACRLPHCDLLADPVAPYCRVHAVRWHQDGCPADAAFEAAVLNYGDPRWDFRRLPPQLKLELQYGLQRSYELGYGKSAHSVGYLTRMLLRIEATTLLERTRAEWTALFRQYWPDRKDGATARVFLGFAVEQLSDLLDGAGWDNEYPRDLWQLHRLGYVAAGATRQLNFTDVGQRWLMDCAKRWLHWRLTVEEKSVNTVLSDLMALRRLSAFLTATGQAQHSIRQLTRPVLEQHVASLHECDELASSTIRDHISAIAVFLRALQDHEDWAPDLPRNAVIYSSDYPRMDPLRARGLNTHVMTQVRAHLPDWPHPDGRFLTELMIATGLRLGDACALGYDPLVFDNDANPYIRYWNHKMRREAYVPISQALLDRIRTQQQRTAQRFPSQTAGYLSTAASKSLPAAGLKLTPRTCRNPDGGRPFAFGTYQQQLRVFQATAQIGDEADRPVTITAHQWRHTFATGLINRGVRLEVVKQLLDHSSLEMSSHYARLLDTTIRTEWEAGRGPDDDYGHLLPTEVEWANRARTALPNGHCGLPRQQSCDHSNKCLPCPVFITTSQDLPAHEEQRTRTLILIDRFDQTGATRLADQNRVVLEQLDLRIEQIKKGLAGKTTHDAS
jgi:integrase